MQFVFMFTITFMRTFFYNCYYFQNPCQKYKIIDRVY